MYIRNRCPTKSVKGMTPYEALFGSKPSVTHLHIFGCIAYSHVAKDERRKLDSKSQKLIRLGYADNRKAYRLYDFQKRRVVFSCDVFNKKVAGYSDEESDNETPHVSIDISEDDKTVETETINEENVPPDNEQGEKQENNETRQEPEIAPRRSTRERRALDRYGEWINQASHIEEPQTVDEALTCSIVRYGKKLWMMSTRHLCQTTYGNL